MRSHVTGVFLAVFIVYWAISHTGDSSNTYLDPMSLIIVVGGSLSVAIMTNGLTKTFKMFSVLFKAFSPEKHSPVSVTKELVEISRKHHFGTLEMGQLKNSSYHPFVIDGIKLLHNKFDSDKLRTIMTNLMIQRQEQNEKITEQLETLAKYPPAFGMMGTIIGLVAVLKEINTPQQMSNIGPSMAIALLTTLYGILLSNYVLQPIADNLQTKNYVDIKVRQIIAEGTILISEGHDPIYIREVLLSFLTPDDKLAFTQLKVSQEATEEMAA